MTKSDRFPVTRQSAITALKSADQSARASAYDAVLACYWKPTYKLIRLKWQLSREAAEDLTQGFFATAFEKKYFERYDPELARFHTFLQKVLQMAATSGHPQPDAGARFLERHIRAVFSCWRTNMPFY